MPLETLRPLGKVDPGLRTPAWTMQKLSRQVRGDAASLRTIATPT